MAKLPYKLPVSKGRAIVIDKSGRPKAPDKTPKPLRGAKQRKKKRLIDGLKKPKQIYRPASNPDDVD